MLIDMAPEIAGEIAGMLAALGNVNRLYIMQHLRKRELSVGKLAELVGLSQSAVSQHLARLRKLGMVETRRDRQTVFYTCAHGVPLDLLEAIDNVYVSHHYGTRKEAGESHDV